MHPRMFISIWMLVSVGACVACVAVQQATSEANDAHAEILKRCATALPVVRSLPSPDPKVTTAVEDLTAVCEFVSHLRPLQ